MQKGVKNIIATAHTAADIYKDLLLIHFIQRHCVRSFTCITEIAERSFFGTSQLYTPETKLKKRNHFTIHNCLTYNVNRSSLNPKLSSLNSKPKRFTLGIVSRLATIKGMDLVIPAFAEVLKQHPETRLIVVGDGTLRSTMEQQATESGCGDHIIWAGRQPQKELSKWYSLMDVVLMPSRSEPCGLAQMIASGYGTVPVVRETGGLYDTIKPYFEKTTKTGRISIQGNGFTFQTYNAHDMLYVINYAKHVYYDNKRQWNQMVDRGITKDFSWNASKYRYEGLYRYLLGE